MLRYALIIIATISFIHTQEIQKHKGTYMGSTWTSYQVTDEKQTESIVCDSHNSYIYSTLNKQNRNAVLQYPTITAEQGIGLFDKAKALYKARKKRSQ